MFPQESGSHWGAEFAELSDGETVLRASGMKSFSATEFDAQTLTDALHDSELIPSGKTYFYMDYAMSDVGSASCGPLLAEEYRMPNKGKGKIVLSFRNTQNPTEE